MKYFFLVHSHITYYLSISVIKYYGYSECDVLLILGRGYKNEYNSYNSISIDRDIYLFEQISPKTIFKYTKKIRRYIKEVDSLIANSSDDSDYTLYLPHFLLPFMQVLATNKHCKRVNFIEEGASSYSSLKVKTNRSTDKFKAALLFGMIAIINKTGFARKRYVRVMSFFDYEIIKDKVDNFFCISNLCFPFISGGNKIILKLYEERQFSYRLKYQNLLFFEGVVEQKYCLKENYYKAIQYLLDDNSDIKQFSIKYHPEQTDVSKREIEQILVNHGILVDIIPPHISVEQIFLNYAELNVFGFFTSLLFYGFLMGHNIKSYDNYLQSIDTLFYYYRRFLDLDLSKYLSKKSR